MDALISFQQRLGRIRFTSRGLNSGKQLFEVTDKKRRVRLARGSKSGFHAQMKLYIPCLEPGPATFRKLRGLGNLPKSQNIDIECTRPVFFA